MRILLLFLVLAFASVDANLLSTKCNCALPQNCAAINSGRLPDIQPRAILRAKCKSPRVCCQDVKSNVDEDEEDDDETNKDAETKPKGPPQKPGKGYLSPKKKPKPAAPKKPEYEDEDDYTDQDKEEKQPENNDDDDYYEEPAKKPKKKPIKKPVKKPTNYYKPKHSNCGTRQKSEIVRRLVSDEQNVFAEVHEFPWQVAILKEENSVYVFRCSGVIIDDDKILTSAHNVRNVPVNSMVARVGENDLTRTNESMFMHQDLIVHQVITHPEYDDNLLSNDLAIMCVKKMTFSSSVTPICLPENENQNFENRQCLVSGWGKDKLGGNYSPKLKRLYLNVLDSRYCQDLLGARLKNDNYQLHPSFLCAGGKRQQDSCEGDGGGPLGCVGPDRRTYLAGTVSWGIGCGESNVPGVYSNVASMLDWIQSVKCDQSGNGADAADKDLHYNNDDDDE